MQRSHRDVTRPQRPRPRNRGRPAPCLTALCWQLGQLRSLWELNCSSKSTVSKLIIFFVNLFSPKVNDLCEERAGGFAQKTCGWRPRLSATQAAGRPEPVWVLGPPPPPARPPAAARPRQVVARGAVSTQTGAPRAARGNSLLEPLSRFRPLVSLNQEPRDLAA